MKLVINNGKDDEFTIEVVGTGNLDSEKQSVLLVEMVHAVMSDNFFNKDILEDNEDL